MPPKAISSDNSSELVEAALWEKVYLGLREMSKTCFKPFLLVYI